MNRHNIWIHIGLACVLVTFAAVLGQMERWRVSLRAADTTMGDPLTRRDDPIIKRQKASHEVLVRFKPGTTLDKIKEIVGLNHDQLADEIESVSGLSVIDDLDNADAKTVAAQYAMRADVAYAEVNQTIKTDDPIQKAAAHDLKYRDGADLLPGDPMFGEQWALHNLGQDGGTDRADIDALKAWKASLGSPEVVVAVLDSGVDYNHEDLKNNMWMRSDKVPAYVDDELGEFQDIHGFDATNAVGGSYPEKGQGVLMSDPMDVNGHGTHCAGIIGAEGDNGVGIVGVNWHVKIMPLKFLDETGAGTTETAIEAINYVIDRKKHGVNVRVISASWGSNEKSEALEDAIRAAGDAGILFVAAAGNDGTDNDQIPHYPSNYELSNVISVAALDRNDQVTTFSNFGAKSVHIAAPGKDILSTWPGNNYREASGTSMATPFVSGVAALIIANNPGISMMNLRKTLLNGADKLPQLKGKVLTGARLCAANSVAGRNADQTRHGVDQIVSGPIQKR